MAYGKNLADYEALFTLNDGNSDNFSVKPRWQRKKEQGSDGGAGDRFIANRGAMDLERSSYRLSKENSGGGGNGNAGRHSASSEREGSLRSLLGDDATAAAAAAATARPAAAAAAARATACSRSPRSPR